MFGQQENCGARGRAAAVFSDGLCREELVLVFVAQADIPVFLDRPPPQFLERVARIGGGEEGFRGVRQMRFGAQAVNYTCQLNRDVTSANNRNAFWQGRQFEETVGVDTVFHTRNVRVARAATGGDQDMIGGDRLAVDFDRFGINKARKTSDHIDVVFAQYVVIRGMDTVDISRTAGNQLVPVKVIDGGVKAVIRAIHMNSFTNSKYSGSQTFYYDGNPENEKLASIIHEELRNVLDKDNRRAAAIRDDVFLIKELGIPSVLVEAGFLSNPEEERLLQTEEYQEKIAWAIYVGIMKYLNDI